MTGHLTEKNGKYYAVINLKNDGKYKQKWFNTGFTVNGRNKTNANKFLRDKIIEFEKQELNVKSDIMFSDYIINYLEKSRLSIDVVTHKTYVWISEKHIIPYFANKKIKLSNLTVSDIQEFINYKSSFGRLDGKGGLSPKTVREQKNIINLACNDAVKNDLINKNPCLYVKLPQLNKNEPSFFEKNLINDFLTSIESERLYYLLYFTVYYGLRREEVLGLKWDSIDYSKNQLLIKHTRVKYRGTIEKDKTKNKSSYRSYPLCEKIISFLSILKEQEEINRLLFGKEYVKNDYIFKWENGTPYSPDYVSKTFSKLLAKYNYPHIRFHDLRHTTASLLIDNNCSLKDIQEWLGHSSIQTTANVYGHITCERKKIISNSMTSILKNS